MTSKNGIGNDKAKTAGPIIGIDLGTSTSAIAVLVDGKPQLIPDERGDRMIPSVVQLSLEGEFIVGGIAKASAVTYYDRTSQEVKRLMGTGEGVRLGDKTLTPEAISAVILRYLKATAEKHLGEEVRD